MTQKPVGEVVLVERGRPARDRIRRARPLQRARSGSSRDAVAGRGRPSADGVDGVKSLAVALAVREAAQTGRAVRVNYEGF